MKNWNRNNAHDFTHEIVIKQNVTIQLGKWSKLKLNQ